MNNTCPICGNALFQRFFLGQEETTIPFCPIHESEVDWKLRWIEARLSNGTCSISKEELNYRDGKMLNPYKDAGTLMLIAARNLFSKVGDPDSHELYQVEDELTQLALACREWEKLKKQAAL